jgi:hypothetical protein
MQTRWKLGLAIAVPSMLALGFVAWGGYWSSQRVREGLDARTVVSAFITAISDGRVEEAYRAAAPELRCRMTPEQFRGLANYYGKLQPGLNASVSLRHGWPNHHVADIEVATHYDQDLPHHAALLKLEDGWRVAWIDRQAAAVVQAMDRKCGERSTHIAMIRGPILDLLQGFERGDYDALAERFHPSRNQTAASVARQYAQLQPKAAALKEAARAEPAFDADPAYAGNGWKLTASLRGQGVKFSVRADLVLDGGWKLMRFDIDAASEPN